MAKNNHQIFSLVWKSQFGISKETVDEILKELNNEIRYLSTTVLPRTKTAVQKRNILKDLDALRKQRDSILMKYDDNRFPRASGGLGGDAQSTDENYQVETKQKSIKKSISKRDVLKALYARAWGSMAGLNEDKLEKMTDKDLDDQIKALENAFD